MRLSPPWRARALARLADDSYDVLVVGAGATGAAIARDAALRGLTVALCDSGDYAGQTSSYSSKLIHGGLRYLQYGNFPLVFEALSERHRLLATAPHLCRPVEFLFPAFRGESPSLSKLGLGITIYDALALWRRPVRSRRIPFRELYRLVPFLRSEGLTGAQSYIDCQTDDARLVLENALDAQQAGAVAATYVEIIPPDRRDEQVSAVDSLTGRRFSIRARAIVSATGPFTDAFLASPSPVAGRPAKARLRPTLGVHLVLDSARLPCADRAFVLRSPRDDRTLFVMPAGRRTLVGTTDTDWEREASPTPTSHIEARGSDVNYLLEAVNHAFPAVALTRTDVLSTFAGLRPLLATADDSPSSTSREHEIWLDGRGILCIAGGKLTTMRRMGEEAVDRLIELLRERGLDRPMRPCQTRHRVLPGGGPLPDLSAHELAPEVLAHLGRTYGSRASQVMATAGRNPTLLERLDPELPALRVEVLFAARHDQACTAEDVLRRRLSLFRDARDQGLTALTPTCDLLAAELGWNAAEQREQERRYQDRVRASRTWTEDR